MTAGASRAAPTIAPQPALAPSPQPRPAPTARALPPGLVEQGGQNWTPIGGQICKPIDTQALRIGERLLFGIAIEYRVLAQERALTAIVIPCLQQGTFNARVDLNPVLSRESRSTVC